MRDEPQPRLFQDPIYGTSLRQPPQSNAAEQAFLGAALHSATRVLPLVREYLEPEHFYDPVHGRIFDAIRRLDADGRVADPITVKVALENAGIFEQCGGAEYLTQLVVAMVGVTIAGDYGRVIFETAARRDALEDLEAAVEGCYVPPAGGTAEIISRTTAAVASLAVSSDIPLVTPALYRIQEEWSEDEIPKRPWVAPGIMLRGAVTVFGGPPSAGKSSLTVAQTSALALGRQFGRFRSHNGEPMRCGFYNVEDDRHEQMRRYSGMCRQFGCTTGDLLRNLQLCGPAEMGELLATSLQGKVLVNTRAMDELEQLLGDTRPDDFRLDPFVELHGAEENDNTVIRAVMAKFRCLARRFNLALGLNAHTRKGAAAPGDPDQIRGAGAIVGAARIALTVTTMSEEEASHLGISKDLRGNYFRVDDAKKNYSRLEEAEWFERVEYKLDNGDGVAVPWPWTPPILAPSPENLLNLIDLVRKGSPEGPWSPRFSDNPRSFRAALVSVGIETPASQKAALKSLQDGGDVVVASFKQTRKSAAEPAKGLRTRDGEPRGVEWIDATGGDE